MFSGELRSENPPIPTRQIIRESEHRANLESGGSAENSIEGSLRMMALDLVLLIARCAAPGMWDRLGALRGGMQGLP